MKMLSVIAAMGVGGAESVAAALLMDAREEGHSVTLASGGGFRADALADQGIRNVMLPLNGRRPSDMLRSVVRLRSTLGNERPDVIHAHNVKASLVARLACGRSAIIVTTLHGVPEDSLRTSARILSRTSNQVVAVSPYVAEQIIAHGFPATRVAVIENSIAPLKRHAPSVAKARLGLQADVPVVLCLARMAPQKRHDLLIQAWADTPGEAVLLMAGDGPTRSEIETRVRRLGIGDRVRFLGERTDADWLLAASELLVLPTDWEGLPISLLEAMGAGVPIIVSKVGGVIETLSEAVRTVEPDSATAIAEALRELLADPERRSQLAVAGEHIVAERYGASLMLHAYRNLFTELTGEEATRRLA